MFIGDIRSCPAEAPCAPPTAKVQNILSVMTQSKNGVVFITEDGRLTGLVTDGDIRRALDRDPNLIDRQVDSIMTRTPIAVGRDTPLSDAYRLIQSRGINILPIVSEDGRYDGFVTFHDIARMLSPERIYPQSMEDRSDANVAKHIARYELASQFIADDFSVLDCACGAGYGSSILAAKAKKVLGVDISEESIAFARQNYARPNVDYMIKDLAQLDFADDSFDAIVSVETLEHVEKDVCEAFLKGISRWLRPGGILLSSSPMLRYRDGKPYVTNPHHINEMPRAELLETVTRCLPGFITHFYHQDGPFFVPLADEHTGFCIIVARKAPS